ncbi:MAG: hypothetical protein DIZ80_08245, partial [endosymbiont of Galathealinum brachiosum]
LKRDSSYKRRITRFDKLQPGTADDNRCSTLIVEYVGTFPSKTLPHGNSKAAHGDYVRTSVKVKTAIQDRVVNSTPRQVYTDMVLNSSSNAPQNLRQVQNIKYTVEKKKRQTRTGTSINRKNNADDIQTLLSIMHEHPFIQEIVQAKDKAPTVILYTDDQMTDMRNVCEYQNSVLGVDRTFNLGPCFVTLFVYKNVNIIRRSSGNPPIQLGPLYLHWDGDCSTYHRFFSHINYKINEFSNPIAVGSNHLVIGSDEEKAMTKAIKMCFPNSTMLLCVRHLEENMRRYLHKKVGVNDKTAAKIINDIFGKKGLVNSDDAHSFNLAAVHLDACYHSQTPAFSKYFSNKLLPQLREYVHLPKLNNKWLPLKWTNNNCESINHILKLTANWKCAKLPDLIDKLHAIAKLQISDMRRALHGQGNYELAHQLTRLGISHSAWGAKSQAEKDKLFTRFLTYHEQTAARMVTSSDGKLKIPRTPTTAKKPGQRKRCRSQRTTSTKRRKKM